MFESKIDERPTLRALTLDHTEQLLELVYSNRAHIGEWMFWVREDYSRADARQHIAFALQKAAAGDGFEAGIWFDDELAGCIRYNYLDRVHRNTELGYWLGSDFQGRGLATLAARAMTDHAFT